MGIPLHRLRADAAGEGQEVRIAAAAGRDRGAAMRTTGGSHR